MNSIETLRAFFGWCSILNLGMLIVGSLAVVAMRGTVSRIHSRMFGLSEAELSRAYFQYIAQYKILTLVLNIVPYIALEIMA